MLLNEMEVFYYVVELNSFSRAAEKLNVSKSYISKRISFLESELKVKLLARSTRNITPTEAGNAFFNQCEKITLEAQKSFRLIETLKQSPAGTLKMSAPIAFGLHLLPHALKSFTEQFPDVKLDVNCENRLVDVIKDGYDLVIRSAKLESSNLIARKLFSLKNIVCASPDYLKKHDHITSPENLSNHQFAMYYLANKNNELKLIKNSRTYKIIVHSKIATNQLDLVKQTVLNGTCLGVLPKFMVKKEIEQKNIIACLGDYEIAPSPIYIIYPNKELSPKVKAFITTLKTLKLQNAE